MPTPPPADDLREAARLLKAGLRADALRLARRVIEQDRRNVAAWWLAAHATSDREEARVALRVVLKLQPDHARAQAMLARLDAAEVSPAAAPAARQTAAETRPAHATVNLAPLKSPARRSGGRWRRNLFTLALIALSLVVLVGGGALLVLNLMGNSAVTELEAVILGDAANATATPASLRPDSQVVNTIRDDQVQVYRFHATTGTELFVAVGFATIPRDTNTSGALVLYDPDGYIVERSSPESAEFDMPSIPLLETGAFALIQFTIDRTGTWSIRLIGQAGRSSGTYVMLMDCSPREGCTPPPEFQRPS